LPHLRAALLALLFAASCATNAGAQEYCLDPSTRQIDPRATATWQQLVAQADPQIMQMLIGVWYRELRSPATSQIDYLYQSFEAGGLYQYRDKVCGGMTNTCLDYQGTGRYAARRQDDGSFFGLIVVSDLGRDHQCTSLSGRFLDQTTILGADGVRLQRVP
jgi:hypothetical protein